MAALDREQILFLQGLRDQVRAECKLNGLTLLQGGTRNYADMAPELAMYMASVNRTEKYGSRLWFISQLFEQDWTPRDTLEHAPPTHIAKDSI